MDLFKGISQEIVKVHVKIHGFWFCNQSAWMIRKTNSISYPNWQFLDMFSTSLDDPRLQPEVNESDEGASKWLDATFNCDEVEIVGVQRTADTGDFYGIEPSKELYKIYIMGHNGTTLGD